MRVRKAEKGAQIKYFICILGQGKTILTLKSPVWFRNEKFEYVNLQEVTSRRLFQGSFVCPNRTLVNSTN